MIAILDYGAGNLASVRKAFEYLGVECEITQNPAKAERAEKLVLPGVGHFAATAELDRRGLREAVGSAVARGTPFLGICVGMQWLFEGSCEAPGVPGLGVFRGKCARFNGGVKVPHVGWNTFRRAPESRLLAGLEDQSFVYYTHSYFAPVTAGTVAQTDYGVAFSAVVEQGNVFGVQFHPEKSAQAGLQILRNFCELPC